MSHCVRRGAGAAPSLSRRSLLGQSLVWSVTGVVAAGCTAGDPRIVGGGPASATGPQPTTSPGASTSSARSAPPASPSTSAEPSQPPLGPGTAELVQGEQSLAALAGAILAGPHRSGLTGAQRRNLTAVRDGHLAHVAALTSPQPTARPRTASTPTTSGRPPEVVARSLSASLRQLGMRERRQSARLSRAARGAVGYHSLLLASMSLAALAYADVETSTSGAITPPPPPPHPVMPAMSDVAAQQAVVRQLHALVYGYQLALGRLSVVTPQGRRAQAALTARRQLRDRLVENLGSRGASVPAAAGAYVPPVQPTSAGKAGTLIRRMEVAFAPFCGLWLASAAQTDDRRLALESLGDTIATARTWGAATGAWPGWRD